MSINLSRVKGLCFDVDGTLSDTDDAWVSSLTKTFANVPFVFRKRDPKLVARRLILTAETPMNSVFHLFDHLSLDDEIAKFYSWVSQRRTHKKSSFLIMNGARQVLETLSIKYPLTVVSARDQASTMRFIHQFELEFFFSDVVTAQTCEYTKPFPHPVLYAANSMGLSAENCVMIGDTTVDILAGKAAGAQTIGVLCGFGTEKELRKAGADLVLPELVNVLEVFAT
jgi:N-acetyl-D-muramate 6-phosphate phosphatase